MNIREALIEARLARGMTQQEVAERAGMPVSSVGRIECGEDELNIKLTTLERIASALGARLVLQPKGKPKALRPGVKKCAP